MYFFYENIDIFKKRFHLYFSQCCQQFFVHVSAPPPKQMLLYAPQTRSQHICVVNVGMKDWSPSSENFGLIWSTISRDVQTLQG